MNEPTPAAEVPGPTRVNDLSLRVATVNGSGSQTANNTLLRALFQMGLPVSGKNLFPSNIAGLPTWFTIRVNAPGLHRAEPRTSTSLVCMNPATAKEDVASVPPGVAGGLRGDAGLRALPRRRRVRGRPVPAAGEGRLRARGAAQARRQHDLRGRGHRAARDRPARRSSGRSTRPSLASPRRWGSTGTPCGRGSTGSSSTSTRRLALPCRADAPRGRHDPRRREHGRGGGLRVRGRHRADLVPHHAVLLRRRDHRRAGRELPPRPPDGRDDPGDRPGRGRARRRRHGHRRGLGRRPFDDHDQRAGHQPDERVRRTRVLRRGADGHHRRAAHGSEHRAADPHAAGRHPPGGQPLARRRTPPVPLPRRSSRGLRGTPWPPSTSRRACRRRSSC